MVTCAETPPGIKFENTGRMPIIYQLIHPTDRGRDAETFASSIHSFWAILPRLCLDPKSCVLFYSVFLGGVGQRA
jgi:hypothetical protein